MTPAETSISIYENNIPDFVETELARLYGTLESTLAYMRAYRGAENASTCVVRRNGEVTGVFLFQRDGRKVHVLNGGIQLESKEIERIVSTLFSESNPVAMVQFRGVRMSCHKLRFPSQRSFCAENTILTLPDTVDTYHARLGTSTRKNIKRHQNRLMRFAPSFCYRVYEKDEVSEKQIRAIVNLNRARMARKNKISSIDESEMKRIIDLVKRHGVVGVVTINGRICAGAITFHIGENYVSRVNAHDPEYDDYRLGILCCYLTICECIRRGGREFHFMHGKYDYKTSLLGIYQKFDAIAVYRSRIHYLLNVRTAIRIELDAAILGVKRWLLDKAGRNDGVAARTIGSYVNRLRKLIRLGRNLGHEVKMTILKE